MSEQPTPARRGRPRRQATRPVEPDPETTDDDEEFNIADLVLEDVQRPPQLKICSQYLCESYFELKKKQNEEMECIVCMEKLDCKSCFTLLNCGHAFHSKCLLFLREKVCPTCRDHC